MTPEELGHRAGPMMNTEKPREKQKLTIEMWEDEERTFATCVEFPGMVGHGESIMAAVAHLLWRLKWDREP